jgi:endonuclease-3
MPRVTRTSAPAARARTIFRRLREEYPDATCSLTFNSPWELLVATILSAQCTDDRVNMVTPPLFRRFPARPRR